MELTKQNVMNFDNFELKQFNKQILTHSKGKLIVSIPLTDTTAAPTE